jgi:hypothetical protein
MVLQPGIWDDGPSNEQPDTLLAGVRIERGPQRNIFGLLGALFHGLAERITEADQRPSVSWREQAPRPVMTPLLDLRTRHQARVRGPVQEPNRRDWLEAWLELERLKELEKSPENSSVTKTVRGWIGPSNVNNGVDDGLNPANTMTSYEKFAPTTPPDYAGEFIGNNFGSEQFTDPRVSQWYPNSAEIYKQELEQAQALQREQAMRLAMQRQQSAMPTSSVMTPFGQKIGSRRAPMNTPKKRGELRIIQPTLGALAGTLMSKITESMLTGGFPIKLSFDEQALLSKSLNAGVGAGMRASVSPGTVGAALHPHDADYNSNAPYGALGAAADRLAQREREKALREAEKRAFEAKIASYPSGVEYVGSLSGILGTVRWGQGKTKAVVVDMSTIDFSNSINIDKLVQDRKGTLYKELTMLLNTNSPVKNNVVVSDIVLQVPALQYDPLTGFGSSLDQHIAYGHIGVNLVGTLEIDKISKKWHYSG